MLVGYGDIVISEPNQPWSLAVPDGRCGHASTGAAVVVTADPAGAIRRLIGPGAGPGESFPELLSRVCRIAANELAATGVGVSVLTESGARGLSAASDVLTENLEDLQFTLGEGPCVEAFHTRRPVLVADLSGRALNRWPVYTPAARQDGVRAIFAFPLQIGAARLGTMDVLRPHPGALTEPELTTALLLADITVEVLLDRQEDLNGRVTVDGLVPDVGNRAQLFQAQGMVMVQLGVTIGEAMTRMRAYAFAENRRLDDVARDIVERRLTLEPDAS